MSGPFGSTAWMYSSGDAGFYDFPISNSLRLGEDGHLTHTNSSDSASRQKFTFATWLKISSVGTGHHQLFDATNNYGRIYFTADDNGGNTIRVLIGDGSSNSDIVTNRKFRDASSWFHLVVAIDTTQGTASNRVKIYINGVQETSFYRNTIMNQNVTTKVGGTALEFIGAQAGPDTYFKGYLAETHYIVNAQLTPSSFGETKNDIWIPKDTAGLTYGTNGYRLQYKQTGTSANSSGIGADTSGNNNHWTPVNLVASDVVPDSPTNNFATYNGVMRANMTFTEGNLKALGVGTNFDNIAGTILFDPTDSRGYYWEWYVVAHDNDTEIGIAKVDNSNFNQSDATHPTAHSALTVSYRGSGQKKINDSASNYGTAWDNGNILSVAVKSGSVFFYHNGTLQASGTAATTSLTGEPTPYVPSFSINGTQSGIVNFGQDSSFAGNVTAQNNTDANGIGDFYYSPPAGYVALCTANLPDPSATVDPNQGGSPQDYFNTSLYTGNGASSLDIDLDFDPDLVWIKRRNASQSHVLANRLSGDDKFIATNGAGAEETDNTKFRNFSPNGNDFRVGGHDGVNNSGSGYVAWSWKAGGSGSSNIDGTINTTATSVAAHGGFSISTYTGTGSDATVGHGLSTNPIFVMTRRRDSGDNWVIGSETTATGFNGRILLDENQAWQDTTAQWRDTAPTSTVVTIGTHSSVNGSSNTYVMFCFANVDGMQRVGEYIGNSNADGTFVYTGFRPAWIMIKKAAEADDWAIHDSKRVDNGTNSNPIDDYLKPNTDASEGDDGASVDFYANGFKWRINSGMRNENAKKYLYLACAEQPFKYANAR
jgi:hypothetical protein